ncbi:MAG: 23S rRNA (adenine(2503)-C(2))-methyltransferase RlmN [Candidatus Dadabacteria bacterium]|nr:MAG: 23S rRNA (adenine(2503)-C(2))-methyltransferase RlmN [Candidatus Dadabacteria bacterium]
MVAHLSMKSLPADMPPAELRQWFAEHGWPGYRARQLFEAQRKYAASGEARITTWSAELCNQVFEELDWSWWQELQHWRDPEDATEKWVVTLRDGQRMQMVMIPDRDRRTLCVSSQVGCAMGCTFCSTGEMRLQRNLTGGEILGQILLVDRLLRDRGDRGLTNLVFMGMGEPLHNEYAVRTALDWIISTDGLGWSPDRVTISTVGIAAPLRRLIRESRVNLAISLHAARPDVRAGIVPAERGLPADELRALLLDEIRALRNRKLTFEVVLLAGINDSEDDARELIRYVSGLNAMVNLIPFNPWPGGRYSRPARPAVERFQRLLQDASISCFIRRTRGRNILAACGTLNTTEHAVPVDLVELSERS